MGHGVQSKAKHLPQIPDGVKPVVRFKNPADGLVTWKDVVKGDISFNNQDFDDLIIARADGTPTYNFCVVVDDLDMGITHVIRGDDHVNNTPKQINILHALNAQIPAYGHVPMILGPDGKKLSKRTNATAVMDYERQGYLPETLVNYLARLGWGHGDDEVFSRKQFIEWFDLNHLSNSPAQWDPKKLNWLNNHYINQKDHQALVNLLLPMIQEQLLIQTDSETISPWVELYKSRCDTLVQIIQEISVFLKPYQAQTELIGQQLTEQNRPMLQDFALKLSEIEWQSDGIHDLIKATLADYSLKMPALGLPLRAILIGATQSPSVDKIIFNLGREETVQRITSALRD